MKIKLNKSYFIESQILKKNSYINRNRNRKPLKNSRSLNECIITASTCKDGIFLTKNRDRAYYPRIEIVHELVRSNSSLERIYFFDIETGWAEGIVFNHETNESFAILNTALSVDYDEKEKEKVKIEHSKSVDGSLILEALTLPSFEEGDEFLSNNTISGHTFLVSSTGKGYKYEMSKYEKEKEDLNLDKLSVRTNHGYLTNSGYEVGSDYASSKIRKSSAEKAIKDDLDDLTVIEILDRLKKKNYIYDSELNMNRDTEIMRTTGQIGIDLTNNIFYYDNLNNKSEIIHVLKKISQDSDITPRIKLNIINAPEDLEVFDY